MSLKKFNIKYDLCYIKRILVANTTYIDFKKRFLFANFLDFQTYMGTFLDPKAARWVWHIFLILEIHPPYTKRIIHFRLVDVLQLPKCQQMQEVREEGNVMPDRGQTLTSLRCLREWVSTECLWARRPSVEPPTRSTDGLLSSVPSQPQRPQPQQPPVAAARWT